MTSNCHSWRLYSVLENIAIQIALENVAVKTSAAAPVAGTAVLITSRQNVGVDHGYGEDFLKLTGSDACVMELVGMSDDEQTADVNEHLLSGKKRLHHPCTLCSHDLQRRLNRKFLRP